MKHVLQTAVPWCLRNWQAAGQAVILTGVWNTLEHNGDDDDDGNDDNDDDGYNVLLMVTTHIVT